MNTTLALAVLVAVAYGVQTTAGFGAGLILVTIGAHLLPIPELLALILPLSILQTGWVSVRSRQSIDWSVLLRRVLPFMGAGVVLGYALATRLAGMSVLKQVLGVFVILLALRELHHVFRPVASRGGGRIASAIAIFGGGIMHGLYATGGPLLVYGLGREALDRQRFRATITVVWLIFNIGLVGTFAAEGRYTPATLRTLGWLAAGLPLGILAGERLFSVVSERSFRILIFGMLALAGAPLALG